MTTAMLAVPMPAIDIFLPGNADFRTQAPGTRAVLDVDDIDDRKHFDVSLWKAAYLLRQCFGHAADVPDGDRHELRELIGNHRASGPAMGLRRRTPAFSVVPGTEDVIAPVVPETEAEGLGSTNGAWKSELEDPGRDLEAGAFNLSWKNLAVVIRFQDLEFLPGMRIVGLGNAVRRGAVPDHHDAGVARGLHRADRAIGDHGPTPAHDTHVHDLLSAVGFEIRSQADPDQLEPIAERFPGLVAPFGTVVMAAMAAERAVTHRGTLSTTARAARQMASAAVSPYPST